MRIVAIVLAVLIAVGMAYIRYSPNDPTHWDVDPFTAGVAHLANGFLVSPSGGDEVAPVYHQAPEGLAREINRVALSQPRTALFAGSVDEGHMTYITRTRVFGFPDFTSVRVVSAPGGATFAAFARSRFGKSDFGVNRDRLESWLKTLKLPN